MKWFKGMQSEKETKSIEKAKKGQDCLGERAFELDK